jgi:hypothetical protein
LASAIRALRAELVEAVRAGEGEEIRFALGPVDLELEVEPTAEGGVNGGIKFWLVSIAGKGSRSSSATHRVKLTLTPQLAGEIGGDRDVLVASELEERG